MRMQEVISLFQLAAFSFLSSFSIFLIIKEMNIWHHKWNIAFLQILTKQKNASVYMFVY